MIEQPILETQRLVLRPYSLADAADLQRLIGEFEVADMMLRVPWPYEDGMAEAWISTHAGQLETGAGVSYAATLRGSGELIGGIGLDISKLSNRAEMGYWMGHPFWGRGYATEAGAAALGYAFETLKLNRVVAEHFGRNPASGRVMQKLGMTYEGTLRQQMRRWDRYEDGVVYGLLASEWREAHLAAAAAAGASELSG